MTSSALPVRVDPDQPQKRQLAEGEVHVYLVRLDAGEYVCVVAEQRGVNLTLRLFTPAGEKVVEVDSPTGTWGVERVSEVAEAAGDYRVDVVGNEGTPAGEYEIRIEEHLVATDVTESHRKRVAAERVFLEGER